MKKTWRCVVCGYIHTSETPPNVCPICGVDASRFEEIADKKEGNSLSTAKSVSNSNHVVSNSSADLGKVVSYISYGLFIITAHADGRDNGQCANTCFQITSSPVRIAIGINKGNYTHELIQKSGKFGVSILSKTGHEYAGRFGYRSGRDIDKFDGIEVHRGKAGILLLNDVLATMEAEVTGQLDCGTHTLFLGDVLSGELLQSGEPMTYDYFRKSK